MTNVDLVRLAGSRARISESPTVDPVTAEVVRGGMETVCFEMAEYVSRTATTPILNQSNERNATILDAQGRLAALSVGIPQFMLTSTLPVRFALEFLGVEEFRDGDVFVANDPYHGGGHLPDYNVFAPVYHDGKMVLIASIQCHHGDTGGGVPGGYNITATDIWGEGVRWPVVKVIDQGKERRDVLYALQANNRIPSYIGDLHAQIGAAQLGVAPLAGNPRTLRHARRRRVRRLHDRLRGSPLPRGSRAVARRRIRSRRVRRPRPARQSRHSLARESHRCRRRPHDRLHRHRHARRAAELVDLRQHARLHGRPDRGDDGSRDPEERRLLRADQAHRAEGLPAQPRTGQARERGNAPSRRRCRRSDRGRDATRAARARRAADVQDRHPDDHCRHRIRARARASPTTPPRCTRDGATRRRAWTRGAR